MTHESHEHRGHEHKHHEHHQHGPKKRIHPAWWLVLGVVLTLGAVLAWVGYPWF